MTDIYHEMFASVSGGAYGFRMQISFIEIIGLTAGACTTFSFLPQVIHTWRTKSVEDISLRMYLLLTFGVMLWLVYGLYLQSLALILTNSVTLALAASILVMKILYGRKPTQKGFDHRRK